MPPGSQETPQEFCILVVDFSLVHAECADVPVVSDAPTTPAARAAPIPPSISHCPLLSDAVSYGGDENLPHVIPMGVVEENCSLPAPGVRTGAHRAGRSILKLPPQRPVASPGLRSRMRSL